MKKSPRPGFEPDQRFPQANREAWLTLALYAVYFLWWYVCAYTLGGGDPEKYTYVFGFPAWFFYSCILGYPLLSLALWLLVRFCFKDLPLEQDLDAKSNAEESLSTTENTKPRQEPPHVA